MSKRFENVVACLQACLRTGHALMLGHVFHMGLRMETPSQGLKTGRGGKGRIWSGRHAFEERETGKSVPSYMQVGFFGCSAPPSDVEDHL